MLVAITTRKVREDIHGGGGKKGNFAKANCDPEVELLPPVWRRCIIVFLAKDIIVKALHKSTPRRKIPLIQQCH